MSFRFARLMPLALLGACVATTAAARTHHSQHHTAAAPKGPTLIWRGDDATGEAVVTGGAEAWKKAGHGTIQMQPFNTASGLDGVIAGTADVAGSARPSDGSAEDARLTFTPVAWDGLVIITQASNPVSSLTLKQVHDIYYGKIHNWNEVGGRDAPIDVYAVASPGDGVEYSLRKLLFGRGNQPVAAPRLYVNTHKLEEGVGLNPNGMGVATFSDVHNNKKLKALSINGTLPTVANIANGRYLLFSPLYLVTNPSSPHAAEAKAFVDFIQTSAGSTALRNHSVLPYQDGAALASLDAGRRSRILADVGAHASHITPVAVPSAAYATASTASVDTLAANAAVKRRADAKAALAAAKASRAPRKSEEVASAESSLDRVKGSVADTRFSSLTHVKGSVMKANDHPAKAAVVRATATKASVARASVTKTRHHSATTYKVTHGDTLFSIAHSHAVNVADLRKWNHLKGNQIKLGQSLRVSHD